MDREFLGLDKDDERLQAIKRKEMVDKQLKSRGIKDEAVLESMLAVPRHRFVPLHLREKAYQDSALAIDEGQTISQPYIVALMTQALELEATDKVLEIGTGSGYAAAILAQITEKVYTIERHKSLAEQAESRFEALDYDNIEVIVADGTKGYSEKAPFDAIVVAAAAPVVPDSLAEQLVIGGRLVLPVGKRKGVQELLRFRKKSDDNLAKEYLGKVRFVPLIGEEGWRD